MDTLSDKKVQAANEISALITKYIEEEKHITEGLKRTGKLEKGLDGNLEDYAQLVKKYNIAIQQVFAKYNLPKGTQLKL